MNKLFLLTLISFSVSAVELKFIGPCSETFIMKTIVADEYTNVGELTIETLKKFNIPHKGTYEGLSSAFETPVGNGSLEVISNEEMRAYGWCFSVDGVAPEFYPHEVPVTPDTKSVTWHYGFARYFRGHWVTQCTPAWQVKPASLCKDPSAE